MVAQEANGNGNSRKLKGRDIITTGIFFALYFILMMIPMVLSGIHPFIWVLFPGLAGVLCGTPFMLLCARVQKPFCVLIMGVVICLLTCCLYV
ncbi:MptD family putative ECF transporter S component [Slackia heliotrinireducens]|uniref:MptD family putative ECF transporter S component n=1 Tax=Slackia heliotrinireducens TaxID=84110 RepID=UPI003315B6FB